jgi:hypothetical protein
MLWACRAPEDLAQRVALVVGQLNRPRIRALSQLLEASAAGRRPFGEPLQP